MKLSVVIPAYNVDSWIEQSVTNLEIAISNANLVAEIIVVNDGSSDETLAVLKRVKAQRLYPLTIIDQNNQGRFLARWEGLQAAKYNKVLFIDARVRILPNSLTHIAKQIPMSSSEVWSGDCITEPTSGIVGHFWEVPTSLFWHRYTAKRKTVTFSIEDFDRYPKGTGCLLGEKEIFISAFKNAWPENEAKLVSDDTKILREIARNHSIRIDPHFSAIYFPRTKLIPFLQHAFERGSLFVDSYWGTSTFRNVFLLVMMTLPVLALLLLFSWPFLTLTFCAVTLLAIVIRAKLNGASNKSIRSFVTLVVPFFGCFWSGLVRGAILQFERKRVKQ